MRSRILVGLIAGTIGGFLGWLFQERLINYDYSISLGLSVEQTRTLIYCVGGLIGLFLGAVDGIVEGNARKLGRGIVIGALAGIVLGYVGYYIGSYIYNLLGGNSSGRPDAGMFSFTRQVIARSFGWALMGLGLGVGSAIATFTPRRIWQGAIGGFLGGFLGGFVFDLLAIGAIPVQQAVGASSGLHDVGGPSRAVGFTAIGALTGLFIGLIQEMMKEAWVKVLAGRNEGKVYILSKAMNIFGRNERSDVPLFADPNIADQHAAIRADGKRHFLIDAGTPMGTVVNGQRMQQAGELLLRDGDMIQIGSQRILFRERATQSKVARPAVDAPKAKPSLASNVPMPGNLCPYCGAAKDPSGGCLCTVASGAGQGAPVGVGSVGMNAHAGMGAMPGMGYGATQAPGGYGPGPMDSDTGGFGAPMTVGTAPASGIGTDVRRLVGIEGMYAGQVFPLTVPNVTVGRDAGRDIALAGDSTVSRSHAHIVQEGGQFVVYDDGSSNGTYVNSMRVSVQPLVPGDIVQFGSSKFRFE